MNQEKLIHRSIVRQSKGSKGYHWHRLCDNTKDKSFGTELTWSNKEVTCKKCLEVLKFSELDIMQEE